MRYFPIFMDLKHRKVVVVGGGEEALRKIRLLIKTEAKIQVISKNIHDELKSNQRVEWLSTRFAGHLLDGAALVYSADPKFNALVSAEAQARGIPINAVDQADISTFIVPSIVDRDPVVIAIGTEGTAPVLAQGIRAKIDAMLPQKLGALAKRAASLRSHVSSVVPHGNRRRSFWQKFFFGEVRDAFFENNKKNFATTYKSAISENSTPAIGRVSLVGAGPGDPELLTLKAQRKLQEADVIVYDRLVSAGVLEMARRDAVRIPVGKTPFAPSPQQAEINKILIREAMAGKIVVRLKGGDPYIFGRGGEEQFALEQANIPVDVVPGITAALGCAASAKLPLSQRGYNRSITLLTGHSETGFAEHDWATLAKPGNVFAIYMGVKTAADISARLLASGMLPDTSVTIIENGTLDNERVIGSTIVSLRETLDVEGVSGPALIYVGLPSNRRTANITPFPVRLDIQDAILKAAS